MKKKFFGILSFLVMLFATGISLVACGQEHFTIEGSIDIQFDGFTASEMIGQMYFSCAPGADVNETDTENGIKFEYGPQEVNSKSEIMLEITLDRAWNNNLVVKEKDGQAFTTRTAENEHESLRKFIINIPFAEKIDYHFTLSKPLAEVKQVEFIYDGDASTLNSQDAEIRDFLDNCQVWVENKEYSSSTNTWTGGFMPLVREQDGQKQFGLAGKYINAELTKETYPLYLKYENQNNAIPFELSTLRNVFASTSSLLPEVEVTEFQGAKVYAFKFKMQTPSNADTICLTSSGLFDLKYLTATVNDAADGILDVELVEAYGDNNFKFSRVGWKTDASQQEWKTEPLPSKKIGEKLILKYKYDDIIVAGVGGDVDKQTFEAITDFENIKFQINGKDIENATFNAAEKSYTFEIGEFDTPETFSNNISSVFKIGVNKKSIKIKKSEVGGKDVTFSSELGFFRGNNNAVFSQQSMDENTIHANVYSSNKQNSDPMIFIMSDLCRYEKFTLNITLNGETYSKKFVRGTDFVVNKTADGALQGAYALDAQSETQFIQNSNGETDNKISWETSISKDAFDNFNEKSMLTLNVDDKEISSQTVLQILLTDVEFRKVDFEVDGDMYGGSCLFEYNDTELTLSKNYIRSALSLKEEYIEPNLPEDESNMKIFAQVYSNELLICRCELDKMSLSSIPGFTTSNFMIYYESYNADPTIFININTSGYLKLSETEQETENFVLITKIVFTIESAN